MAVPSPSGSQKHKLSIAKTAESVVFERITFEVIVTIGNFKSWPFDHNLSQDHTLGLA